MKEFGLFISIFVFGILLPPVGIALFVLWYFWYVMGYAGITKGEVLPSSFSEDVPDSPETQLKKLKKEDPELARFIINFEERYNK